jgi:hypothetical protein
VEESLIFHPWEIAPWFCTRPGFILAVQDKQQEIVRTVSVEFFPENFRFFLIKIHDLFRAGFFRLSIFSGKFSGFFLKKNRYGPEFAHEPRKSLKIT